MAIVTETWFKNGDSLNKEAEDLLLGHDITMHSRNRPPGRLGVAHGGIAIMSKASVMKTKIVSFPNPDEYEVLVVEAKIPRVERPIFLVGVYIPPGYTVGRGRGCMAHVNDIVLHIKSASNDAYICIGGDFNQWEIGAAVEDYPDILMVDSGPTRNNRLIDKVLTNWDTEPAVVLPPLEAINDDGTTTFSDHKVQFVKSFLQCREPVVWKKITFRPFSQKAADAFRSELEREEWENVRLAVGSNSKANRFQETLDNVFDKHFPLKTIRRKDSDLPWLNEVALKKIRRKKAIFMQEGKSENWLRARDDLDKYLEGRQEIFLEKQRGKFCKKSAAKNFHANVKNFKSVERPKTFEVSDLFPGEEEQVVADEVATYFNKISEEF